MELSKFNVTHPLDRDYILVLNTLTSAFFKVKNTLWERLEKCDFNSIPSDFLLQLKENGIICSDSQTQLFQFKYRFYKHAFETEVPTLFIAPTMRCNFSCFYCFEQGNRHQSMMSEEIAFRIVDFLKIHKKNEVNIVWFGGEPMLGFDRILTICDRLEKENIIFSSSMITNGSLVTVDKISLLNRLNLNFIQVSMDGVGKVHDNRRCFSNGKPSFDIVMGNISNLISNSSIPITIQITVDHQNSSSYYDMTAYCNQAFPDAIHSGRLRIGKNYVQDRTGFDIDNVCFTNEELFDEQLALLEDSDLTNFKTPELANPCMYRATWHYAIDPEGNIYKCIEQLGNPSERVGSLKDDEISMQALGSCSFKEDPFNDSECINCNIFPICGGGCPIDRIKKANGSTCDVCSKYKNRLYRLLPVMYHKMRQNNTNQSKGHSI